MSIYVDRGTGDIKAFFGPTTQPRLTQVIGQYVDTQRDRWYGVKYPLTGG